MTAVIPATAGVTAGPADGLDLEAIASRAGTPFFLYDLEAIAGRAARLRAAMPAGVDLAVAAKANPALAVLATLARTGLGADIASGGELEAVIRAGFDPSRVVFTGPGKRDAELDAAVRAGVGLVTVESRGELARLESIARRHGRRVPVLLRAAASALGGGEAERDRIIADGGAGKFGMDRGDLIEAARAVAASAHLELRGLHGFTASNVLDARVLVGHVARLAALAREVAVETGTRPACIDAGGGLGIPYADDEPELDIGRLGTGFAALVARWAGDPVLAGLRVLVEPGRWLSGPAGALVARVVDAKTVDGRRVAVLDAGINHLLRPALTGRAHRISIAGGRASAGTTAAFAGPLCSGLDVLGAEVPVSDVGPGDLAVIADAGAYGFTESMPLFLSHPIPAEVARHGDRVAIIRDRMEPSSFLSAQRVPDWVERADRP